MLTVGFEPIPGYRLENFLGRGQFGEVWRASSPGGTHVALKFLNVRERQGRKEFRAIQKVKGIRHPHLVLTYALWLLDENMQVIDDAAFDNNHSLLNDTFGATLLRMPVQQADKQKPFMLVIATVLCEQNLMERLRDYNQKGKRGFPFQELIGYIEDAAKAIDFLNTPRHELGDGQVAIHHCDIKPENIMVLGDLAVVGDFGVARILSAGADSRTTSMAGSVAYAAPETFDNRIEATSDQYSLAITYYELRTGKLPFPEESQAQVIKDKLAGKLDFSDVPVGEAKVLRRAMAVLPGDRYPTARAFVDALRSAGGDVPQRAPTLTTLLTLAFAGALVLGLVSSAAWVFKFGPFLVVQEKKIGPVEEKKKDTLEWVEVDPPVVDSENEKPIVAPNPIPLTKPFVVSINGNGTHRSLAQAISESSSGETIRILKGTYREPIVVPHSITLIGEGSEGSVTVAYSAEACIKVQNASKVRIENVTVESKSSTSSAVEIENGNLELVSCRILAFSPNSLHGLRLGANGIAVAEKCKFECKAGKAVVAEKGGSVTLRNCVFEFHGNTSSGSQRVAVQGTGANGLVQGCSFGGPCNVGIDWMESPTQVLKVENSTFKNCDIGIQTRSCASVVIQGAAGKPCEVFDAKWGLNLQSSKVDVSRIKVEGNKEKNVVALRITDRTNVNCKDLELIGHECGILVRQSSIMVDRVSIGSARYAGVFVDRSTISGNDLKLTNIAKYGLIGYKGASVSLNLLEIHSAPEHRSSEILALYAASGRIEFKQGMIEGFFCGIFVDPDLEILGSELPDKRVLNELLAGSSWDAEVTNGTSAPVEIVSDLLTLKNCRSTWIFYGAGSSRIQQLQCDLPIKEQTPIVAKKDRFELRIKDLSNFDVLEAKKTAK